MVINLTQGYKATIDDEDYKLISQYKWCVKSVKNLKYAITTQNYKEISMHRLIMNAKLDQQVDHINRNGLDNRKENLRFSSQAENMQNREGWGKSKYKGVSFHDSGLFRARIWKDKKEILIGYFKEEVDAARAYDKAAINLYGDKAKRNLEG